MKYKKWLKNKKVLIPAGMICVLLTIYLILCIMAGTGDFVSNTTINGIKVGQLTQSKAIETLNQQFEDTRDNLLSSIIYRSYLTCEEIEKIKKCLDIKTKQKHSGNNTTK